MKKRIIAVNSNCYHGYSIEEAVAGIKAAGFKYIELTATKGWTEHVFPDMPFERLLAIQDELAAGTLSKARFMEGPIRRSINFIYMPNENLKFAEDFIFFCRKMTRKSLEKRQK